MSITETYGDTLINGLLAGARFRGLQEDLKLARLQALEFESGRAFRKQQEELALQLGQSKLSTERMAQEIQKHQLDQFARLEKEAAEDRPDAVATRGALRKKTETDAAASEYALNYDKSTESLRTSLLENQRDAQAANIRQSDAAVRSSEASAKYSENLIKDSHADFAMKLGKGLRPKDVPQAFRNATHGLAPVRLDPDVTDIIAALQDKGADPKAIPALVNLAKGAMDASIEERDTIRARLKFEQEKEANDRRRDQAAAVGQAVQSGVLAADIVGRNPAALAGIEAAFADNPVVLALARSGVTKQLRPEAQVKMKGLSKAYEDSLARVTQAELDLESGDFTGDSWVSRFFLAGDSEEKKRAKAEKALEAEKKSLQVLENRINQLYASGQAEDGASDGIPLITTQAAYDKLPSKARYREEPNGPILVKP